MADTPKDIAREVLPVSIEDELKQSYMDYAMSVIVGACPTRRSRRLKTRPPTRIIRHERTQQRLEQTV